MKPHRIFQILTLGSAVIGIAVLIWILYIIFVSGPANQSNGTETGAVIGTAHEPDSTLVIPFPNLIPYAAYKTAVFLIPTIPHGPEIDSLFVPK